MNSFSGSRNPCSTKLAIWFVHMLNTSGPAPVANAMILPDVYPMPPCTFSGENSVQMIDGSCRMTSKHTSGMSHRPLGLYHSTLISWTSRSAWDGQVGGDHAAANAATSTGICDLILKGQSAVGRA